MRNFTLSSRHILLSSLLLLNVIFSFAEGTKEIQPNENVPTYFSIRKNLADVDFAEYNADEEHRWHITLCDPNERIYIGLRQDNGDVKFRVKDSNGNIVFTERNIPTSGQGYISDWDEAVAGPQQLVGGAGYNAYVITPGYVDDFHIEFDFPGNGRRWIRYADITVADAGGTIKPGRTWSRAWSMSMGNFTRRFGGSVYMYADDGIVTKVEFNGMQPYHFVISANASGTQNTGTFDSDRQSRPGVETFPQYKVFLNDPDVDCYPTGAFGSITGPITLTGCHNSRCINIPVDQAGYILITLDLDGTPGYQLNTADLQIYFEVVPGDNCIPWDGRDGQGVEIPDGTSIDMQIDYLNGITHLPIYDVENHENGYSVSLVRPAGGVPNLFWDDRLIGGGYELNGCTGNCHTWGWDEGNVNTLNTYWYANILNTNFPVDFSNIQVDANTISAGGGADNDTTICKGFPLTLSGWYEGSLGAVWSTDGTGTFSDNTDINGIYTPSAADEAAGSIYIFIESTGNGPCPPRRDSMRVNFEDPPTFSVSSTVDSVCSNNAQIHLQAQSSEGITWTNGLGAFAPNTTSKNVFYTPAQSEIDAEEVKLIINTDPTEHCPSFQDSITVRIFPAPDIIVNAGLDTLLSCTPDGSIQLNGEIIYPEDPPGGNLGHWRGGNGNYDPSRSNLDAVYTPTAQELNQGFVNLTLHSHQWYGCMDESDNLVLTFDPPATLSAGNDQIACGNNPEVQVNATISEPMIVEWSTSGTGTFSQTDTLEPVYTLSAADLALTEVWLYIETNDPAACVQVKDSLRITIQDDPIVVITEDNIFSCSNNPNTQLNASFSNASGVTWISGDGTYLPNNNIGNPTYAPSNDEIATGIVTLIAESQGNGGCSAARDTVNIILSPAPSITINPVADVCENNADATLSSTVFNASSQVWSGGAGTFTPNNTSFNPTYTPTAAEIASGSVTLTLTANRDGCNPVDESVTFNITDQPTVDAGPVQSICENNADITLNGSFTLATGAQWSNGNGSYSTNDTDMGAEYTPTAAEISSGALELYLTTSGNGICNAVQDTFFVTFTPAPTVDAGPAQNICSNNPEIQLTGTSSTGFGRWRDGNGTYSPNDRNLTPTYTPTAAEIASGSVTLEFRSRRNGNCNREEDFVTFTFTPAPTVDITSPVDICADAPDITLTSDLTVATNVIWTGGAGTYTPNNQGNGVVYTPTATEVSNGSVTIMATSDNQGDCLAETDEVTFNFEPLALVNAGNNQILCGDVTTVQLAGNIQNSNGGTWTTLGSGSFSNASDLNATYTPSAADINNEEVDIVLTSNANGVCAAITDTVTIEFTETPALSMGADMSICSGDFPITLAASGSPGSWSGGSGSFSPNNTSHTAEYTPTAGELTAGSVNLTFTTDAFGACPTLSETVTYTLIEGPEADAGPDQTICGDQGSFTVNGTINNAGGGFWTTTGNGSFASAADVLNNTYNVSSIDTSWNSTSQIQVILSTTGNGICATAADTALITFQPATDVYAGPDQTMCASVTDIQLNGDQINAGIVTWTGGAGSFAPNANTTTPIYQPTAGELSSPSITLTLTAPANGACAAVSDDVTFTFDPVPTVNAGSDFVICSDSTYLQLAGTVTNATGGYWLSDGTGVFSPNNADLNAQYHFSPDDTLLNTFTFTLVTEGNATCDSVTHSFTVTKNPAPELFAGNDTTACSDDTGINLNAVITIPNDVQWTTSGTGTFVPDNNLATIYQPSQDDIDNGAVNLTITTVNTGLCKSTDDNLILNIQPKPTVDAGFDQIICADERNFDLAGTITDATQGVWAIENGTGTIDDPNALTTFYTVSDADTANGFFELTLTSVDNGFCSPTVDTIHVDILPTPVVEAGPDVSICADSSFINLPGSVKHADNGMWTSTGTGNFYTSPADSSSNYVPTSADIASGGITLYLTSTGNGTCQPQVDSLLVSIAPAPTIDAGFDAFICADNKSVPLSGSITEAAGSYWTTTGSGTFTPDSSALNAVYVPSSADSLTGTVILTLNSNGTGLCRPVTDNLTVSIAPIPEVFAGTDQTVCADQFSIPLDVATNNIGDVSWTTSGTGVFDPNNFTEVVSYTPSSADTTTGSVELVLEAEGLGACDARTDTVIINFTPTPTLSITASETDICALAGGRIELEALLANSPGGVWTTTGSGSFSPSSTNRSPRYQLSSADEALASIDFTFTSETGLICAEVSETVTVNLHDMPTVNVGNDSTTCGEIDDIAIYAASTNANEGYWISNGPGRFIPDSTGAANYYEPTQEDIDNGSVSLQYFANNDYCPYVSDEVTITLATPPTVNAGTDLTVCLGMDSIGLNAGFTIATGITWSTTGSGSFSPDSSSTNAVYVPSAADQAAGTVQLIATTVDYLDCQQYEDAMNINFSAAPAIDAGPNKTVCENDLPAQLEGNGTTAEWTGGAGVFSPSNSALDATYQPTAAEITAGSVTLTLTTIKNGTCIPGVDNVTLTFESAPELSPLNDLDVCSSDGTTTFNVTPSGNASGVTWTTSGSGSFNNANSTSPVYTYSSADITDGLINFTATTMGNLGGICSSVSENFTVTISPEAILSVADSLEVCENNRMVELVSSVSNAPGITWSGGSGTYNPDNTSLTTEYTPSNAEATAGEALLTLSSTGSPVCNEVSQVVVVTITPSPTITLDALPEICKNTPSVSLTATVNNADNVTWSGTGSGIFSNPNNVLTNYTLHANDTVANSITFTATSTGNGNCLAVSNDTTITLIPEPIVFAGIGDTICASQTIYPVSGTMSNSAASMWSTLGNGTFANATNLNTNYTIGANDIINGGFTLQLSSDGNTVCNENVDFIFVTIFGSPDVSVNSGLDQIVCKDVDEIRLQGSYYGADGAIWSGGLGGVFTPDTVTMEASYIPTPADTAAGQITIILSSMENGICQPIRDTLEVTMVDLPTISLPDSIQVCADTSAIALQVTVNNAGGRLWSSAGNGTFITSAADTLAVYQLSQDEIDLGQTGLTVSTTQNGVCDGASASMHVEIMPIPILSISDDLLICDSETNIDVSSTIENATGVTWTTNNGLGSFSVNGIDATYDVDVNDPALGVITLIATSTGNGLCKAVDDRLTVTFQESPMLSLGPDFEICQTSEKIIPELTTDNLTSGVRWASNGTGFYSPSANANAVEYYLSGADQSLTSLTLQVSTQGDAICPLTSDQVVITLTPEPNIELDLGVVCELNNGAAINAIVDQAISGQWSTDGTGSFGPSANQESTTYYPSVTDATNGGANLTYTTTSSHVCGSFNNTGTLFITPLPVANAGVDRFICRNGTTTVSAANNTQTVSYAWYDLGGTLLSNSTTMDVTVPIQESYVLEVTSELGCQVYDTVTISTYDLPTLNLPPHFCLYDYTVLDGTPNPDATVPGVYQWYINDVIIDKANTSVYDPRYSGTHKLVFDYQGCNTETSTSVTDLPEVDTDDELGCINENVTITTTQLADVTYQWIYNGGTVSNTNSATILTQADTNQINVYVTDLLGCTQSDSAIVIGIIKPILDLVDTNSCEGETIILDASTQNGIDYTVYEMSYNWSKDGANLSETNDSLSVNASGLYKAVLTIDQCIAEDSSLVTLFSLPVSELEDSRVYCSVDSAFITLSVDASGDTYLWSTGETTSSIEVSDEGVYSIIITNNNNCSTADSISISDICPPRVFIPEGFIPGGADEDKYFRIYGTNFANFKITIYNRWGEVIFYSEDPNFAWDGSYLGKPMPGGVYPYIIEYEGDNEMYKGPFIEEGKVTIVR